MPKKKDKPPTCDAATDPPEPLEFDPFDLDSRGLLDDFNCIPTHTKKALDELKQQQTTGAPKIIKDNVIIKLETVLRWMQSFARSLDKARTVSHRFQCIERDIHEIKTTTKEIPCIQRDIHDIKTTTKEIPSA